MKICCYLFPVNLCYNKTGLFLNSRKGGIPLKTAQKTDRIILIVLALLLVLAVIRQVLPSSKEGEASDQKTGPVTYEDYNGKNIGIMSGTHLDAETFHYFPDSEYFYFDGYADLNIALENHLIDAYLGDEPSLKSIHAQQPQIDYIKERLTNNKYSFAFRKDDPEEAAILAEFNEFLQELKSSGEYEEIDSLWFGTDEEKKVVDMSDLTGENGTLRVITTPTDEPFSYIKDGKLVGYDIDVTVRFCRARGYDVEFVEGDYSARIPALVSGRVEFTTTMNVTPEREESVLFSEAVSEGGLVVAVRSEDLNAEAEAEVDDSVPFYKKIANSFYKNFIRENRWKEILKGLGTTCLITASAIILGTVLAFLICLLRRTGSRLGNLLCDLFVKLMQGTPSVVLLMILFYVVFIKTGLSAVSVAIIGFAMNFGAYASEIIRSGIDSIDPGQREAALALGYSENQAFFRFILPQAALYFLPVYRGEAVSLLKSTSVVGYITVLDLTKMSDIIRARTYEAFFPLIATAVLYFLLSWIISLIIKAIIRHIDTKRSRKAKEVSA